MSDTKINIEAILSKYRGKILLNTACSWNDENVKTAIKEIVEAIVDKCEENLSMYSPFGGIRAMDQREHDRESIKKVKKLIDYGNI